MISYFKKMKFYHSTREMCAGLEIKFSAKRNVTVRLDWFCTGFRNPECREWQTLTGKVCSLCEIVNIARSPPPPTHWSRCLGTNCGMDIRIKWVHSNHLDVIEAGIWPPPSSLPLHKTFVVVNIPSITCHQPSHIKGSNIFCPGDVLKQLTTGQPHTITILLTV